MVGRVFTVQFMPVREDVDSVARKKPKSTALPRLMNQTAIDMLQPGDVLVVDLFGKKVNGTIVGDNLFYYVMTATHKGGLVVDGSVRDLDGISEIDMPGYIRSVDPTPIGNVMLTGINIPIRIGDVTVMPGDLAVGDREGVYFIPPQFVKQVLDRADEIHIHDEWTKKEICGREVQIQRDLRLRRKIPSSNRNTTITLKQKLEELRKQRASEQQ